MRWKRYDKLGGTVTVNAISDGLVVVSGAADEVFASKGAGQVFV